MIKEIPLPAELTQAAAALEQRFKILRIPTRKVALAEWNVVPETAQGFIPAWLPSLLAGHSLCGGVLECLNNDDDATWQRVFGFGPPEIYKDILLSRDYTLETELLAQGFVPISHEQNGDFWVTSITGGPEAPIYLFSLTDMDRIFASSRIALLLASMAISQRNFDHPTKPKSVMWHPES